MNYLMSVLLLLWVVLGVGTMTIPFPKKWNVLGCFLAVCLFIIAAFMMLDWRV